MAKLNRVTGKVFGATASPTGDVNNGAYIGQFGSAQAGTFVGTDDIATIQNLSAWNNGWIDAVMEEDKLPPLPERTGVDKVLSYQECYLLQRGVAEWDSATDYYTNCYCSYNGVIYKSLTDSNTNNQPDVSPVHWEVYGKISQYTKFAINKGAVPLLINNSNELAFDVDNSNPLTYTNINGETRTVTALNSIDVPFTQPVLSANGTLGGASFAVGSDLDQDNRPQYYLFDNNSATAYTLKHTISAPYQTYPVTFYNPQPLNVTGLSFDVQQQGGFTGYPKTLTLEGSNDGTTWSTIGSYNNTSANPSIVSTFDISDNTNYYNYYKITVTDGTVDSDVNQLNITATYQVSTSDGTYKVVLPKTGNQPYLFDGSFYISEKIKKTYSNIATSINAISSTVNSGSLSNAFNGDKTSSSYVGFFNSGLSVSGVCYIGQNNLTKKIEKISFTQGGYNQYNTCVSSAKIQISSDGITWTDVQTVTLSTSTGSATTTEITVNNYTIPSNPYQMRILANSGVIGSDSYSWFVNEVEFYVEDDIANGTIWINPQELYTAQQYDGSNWQDFNDVLLLDSSVTVSGGLITALEQPKYNNPHITPNKQYISGLGMPSDKYIDLTLGASGSTYIAPANGYFYLSKVTASTNQNIALSNTTKNFIQASQAYSSGITLNSTIMVEKNDSVNISYSANGTTNAFRFIYAEGEV